MEVVLVVAVLAVVVALLVLQPLRSPAAAEPETDRRPDLEAAKEAKYREIKDAELDFQMGKMSKEEWRALDGELRAQAIEILRELDQVD